MAYLEKGSLAITGIPNQYLIDSPVVSIDISTVFPKREMEGTLSLVFVCTLTGGPTPPAMQVLKVRGSWSPNPSPTLGDSFPHSLMRTSKTTRQVERNTPALPIPSPSEDPALSSERGLRRVNW